MPEIRPFAARDLDAVIALLAEACPREEIDAERFANHVLLQPDHHPDGLLVAVSQGRVWGVVNAVMSAGGAHPDGVGWITLWAVARERRREGIGGALLEAALSWLSARGATMVDFAAHPAGYFLPGLDAEEYPDAASVLASRGFVPRVEAVGQAAKVVDEIPADVATLQTRREGEGYTFADATWADLPEAMAWANAAIAPTWGDILRDEAQRRHRPDRLTVCRNPEGRIVGVSTFASYDGDVARFGPIAVDDSQRGKGLGAILLAITMAKQAREGATRAYFLWGETEGPAMTMYTRAGWRVERRFTLWRRTLG